MVGFHNLVTPTISQMGQERKKDHSRHLGRGYRETCSLFLGWNETRRGQTGAKSSSLIFSQTWILPPEKNARPVKEPINRFRRRRK